jgi:hypothetical protein
VNRRLVWFGSVTAICWLIALYLAVSPVRSHYDLPRPINAITCPRPVPAVFDDDSRCTPGSQRRLGTLLGWLVLTGAVSTGFLAACARRPVTASPPAE